MRKASGLYVRIERFPLAERGPYYRHTAPREGDQRLGVVFALTSSAVVEGP